MNNVARSMLLRQTMPRMLPAIDNGLWLEKARREKINRGLKAYIGRIPPYIVYIYSVLYRGQSVYEKPGVDDFKFPVIPRKDRKRQTGLPPPERTWDVENVRGLAFQKEGEEWVYKYQVDYTGFPE